MSPNGAHDRPSPARDAAPAPAPPPPLSLRDELATDDLRRMTPTYVAVLVVQVVVLLALWVFQMYFG